MVCLFSFILYKSAGCWISFGLVMSFSVWIKKWNYINLPIRWTILTLPSTDKFFCIQVKKNQVETAFLFHKSYKSLQGYNFYIQALLIKNINPPWWFVFGMVRPVTSYKKKDLLIIHFGLQRTPVWLVIRRVLIPTHAPLQLYTLAF